MKDIDISTASVRMETLKRRVKMLDNDWTDLLDEEIKAQFHEKTYPQVKKMLNSSMNIFRRIVREICSVYREPAERRIAGASDAINEKLKALYTGLIVDQTMAVAHRYSKAGTICFVMVRQIESGLFLRVLTPDQVYIETDDENLRKITVFAYVAEIKDNRGVKQKIWTVYTPEERYYANNTGKALSYDPRTGGAYDPANVYGIIPAVAFPAEFQILDFWSLNWNKDAYEANIKIGLMNTYLDYLVKTQSFKQITISADSVSDDVKGQILDPLFPLLLSGGGTAQVLDLNTQLAAIDQVIRGKVSAIANNYGISNENFSLTTQAASGFSLKIANQSLQDIRLADIPLCASVEQSLYKIIATMSDDELPEDGVLTFNPGEVTWPEEWATERDRWEFEFENGLASPVDYLIANDPQLDRIEAGKIIKERQAEIKALKPITSAWDLITRGKDAAPALAEEAVKIEPEKAAVKIA